MNRRCGIRARPTAASHELSALGWVASLALALLGSPASSAAQPVQGGAEAQSKAAFPDLAWRSLSAAQRRALQPLEREWGGLDLSRRQKWLEIADRFPTLSPEEQSRAQAQMAQWAQLSPQDRGKARLLFQQAKQVSPTDRGPKWQAYQALPEEEKRQLVERAAATAKPSASQPGGTRAPADLQSKRSPAGAADARGNPAPKSNLVLNPGFAAPPTPVSPTVTQAAPGATTSLISKRPQPPSHQQTGLPKITATPGFVDQTTLLPKRGPQAAATTPPAPAPAVPRP